MKILLDTEIIAGCHIAVTESIKQYYEIMFNAVIDKYGADLFIDDVDEIIITDRMTEKVKKYQRDHGITEELTDNEFGSVFGKTIPDKRTGKQVIFLNAEEATYLLDDRVIDQSYKDDESKKKCRFRRDRIINLLIHELSHAEYNSLVKTQTEFPCNNPYDEYLVGLVIIMFEEYYACRRASEVSIPSHNEYLKESISDIEASTEKIVKQFRAGELKPAAFIALFLEQLQMSLNEMCYLLGDVFSSKVVEDELKGTKISVIVDSVKKEFNELYIAASCKRQILIPLCLRSNVLKYYNLFNIDFITDSQGTYIKYIE